MKLCLWCAVTLVWIDLGVIFNSVLKVVCECGCEGLFVVAKRSREGVCRCMSCWSQSEELMVWRWLKSCGVVGKAFSRMWLGRVLYFLCFN